MTFSVADRIALKSVSSRSAAALAALLLCGSLSSGIVMGLHQSGNGCGAPSTVQTVAVIVTNLAINGLLASGYFTLGLTTLLAGPPLLILTGYTIGRTVQAYGGQGVGLLLPHGVLEVSTWAAAMYLGLTGLRLPARADSSPSHQAHPNSTGRVITYIILATILAGIIERIWTSLYGPQIVCKS